MSKASQGGAQHAESEKHSAFKLNSCCSTLNSTRSYAAETVSGVLSAVN